jgi:lipopolysaccharide/colanic/teichoic acid biosynthesis glycosyltransferase
VASGAIGEMFRATSAEESRLSQSMLTKRVFDLVLTVTILLLLGPVLLLISAIVITSGWPVFYVHRRIGWRGRMFGCIKFRTMRANADAELEGALNANADLRSQWEARQKLRLDPRVTRVGRVLRETSVDELPQLFNVLMGDMSLVGPRPVVPGELQKHYGPTATAMYLAVRPGITGLWQVSGRSDMEYADRVALDCAYVTNMSIAYDVRLLIRTVGVLIHRSGAC